jgi:Cu(I)/Ag(I) efflux system membrane protein CusA/SilA
MLSGYIRFFLENKLVAILLLALFIGWGVSVAPFNWDNQLIPRDPVPVDAIPDIGENQQIVFTKWMGRSPQDVEDQITYPLTTALLGVPGIKTIRSSSMFGFSSIYIIFEEDVEFYWSRSRILEKLNSLPAGTLPAGIAPTLGPDATALGQVYWYTLEGTNEQGEPAGGWDPQELRSIQDYTVKYALAAVSGVSEVASIGGFVKEYQIDLDPTAMKAHGITIPAVITAVKNSNIDVGAKTIEMNRAEYLVRGLGYVKSIEDLEESVVAVRENVPIRIKDVAVVSIGPSPRRGALDKGGADAVGGVVVARYGANPLEVINLVKKKIEAIGPGLPEKVLADGTVSKVSIKPFYDRSHLIKETLGTLEEALTLEVLITIIVIILMIMNLRASLLISGMLPVAVLMCFIAMRYFRVDANIVSLSGIAIAIGTMVDIGIVLSENIIRHLQAAPEEENKLEVVFRATKEVASAVITAVATTIVSFLPVFTMVAAEGKLFKPLAFTKTFALLASLILAISLLPPFAHWLFTRKSTKGTSKRFFNFAAVLLGVGLLFIQLWAALFLIIVGVSGLISMGVVPQLKKYGNHIQTALYALFFSYILTTQWLPLGPEKSGMLNFIYVCIVIGVLISLFYLIIHWYTRILAWCLENKWTFLSLPVIIVVIGMLGWIGFNDLLGIDDNTSSQNKVLSSLNHLFPGTGEEFMPPLDEGSFLLMPTSMPHSGIEENRELVSQLDMAVSAIPEVESVVGKLGRVESALDPAPISMFENVINYRSEYITDEDGRRVRFKVDNEGNYVRDSSGQLVPHSNGKFFRNWRSHILSPSDIWDEISKVQLPGVTAAPRLQPIEARLIMLQTGMRAPMGIKIKGPHLDTIEAFGYRVEKLLKEVPGVKKEAVFADRIVGKPYLEIDLDRKALARHGLTILTVQHYIEAAIGGMTNTQTVEGRERYPVRVRYARELRDDPGMIEKILIPSSDGSQIQLGELSTIQYVQGPQVIKSEDIFLQGFVLFDKIPGHAEVDVVERSKEMLDEAVRLGELRVPSGVTFEFAGNYENQIRAEKRLMIVMPLALFIIFLILYFQFRSVPTSFMIFSSIAVAFFGGFIMIWLYGQSWFMNIDFFGTNMRDLYQMGTINLSVAVWVGFIALFGIASDGGVVMATYLDQTFASQKPNDVAHIRKAVIHAGSKRIRPTLMTTATTILALLPILSSTGRGSDIMIPMAIPSFGGMTLSVLTLLVIPVLYAMWKENKFKKQMTGR